MSDKHISEIITKWTYAAFDDIASAQVGGVNVWENNTAYQSYANLCADAPLKKIDRVKINADVKRLISVVWEHILSEFAAVEEAPPADELVDSVIESADELSGFSFVRMIGSLSANFGTTLDAASDKAKYFETVYSSLYAAQPIMAARVDIVVMHIHRFIKLLAMRLAEWNWYATIPVNHMQLINILRMNHVEFSLLDCLITEENERKEAAAKKAAAPKVVKAPVAEKNTTGEKRPAPRKGKRSTKPPAPQPDNVADVTPPPGTPPPFSFAPPPAATAAHAPANPFAF